MYRERFSTKKKIQWGGSYEQKGNPSSKANKIIKKCIQQNLVFKQRQKKLHWSAIHEAHYDWWAFPIDERSSYGEQYMVTQNQIFIMKNSNQFMKALESNAIIVCNAWGWDLQKGQEIITDHKDQKWHNWPIRLYKMCRSLQIFEIRHLFKHAVKYGILIMTKSGKQLRYGHRNISAYLTQKWQQTKLDKTQGRIQEQKRDQRKNQEVSKRRPQSLHPKGRQYQKYNEQMAIKQNNKYQRHGQKKEVDVNCRFFRGRF